MFWFKTSRWVHTQSPCCLYLLSLSRFQLATRFLATRWWVGPYFTYMLHESSRLMVTLQSLSPRSVLQSANSHTAQMTKLLCLAITKSLITLMRWFQFWAGLIVALLWQITYQLLNGCFWCNRNRQGEPWVEQRSRPRRNRKNEAIRSMVRENLVKPRYRRY